ncbi:VOC family protein [Streptomyces sp. H27-D2]|uniref:VOC family protein n=1 Tax=Streptomyces sp. H27-D2 TaxID=3046304 RepID=UPI002DB57313|nr:VOC family protein [Streptomyces sp. H27-D2]MEC4017707.1 VOC family protein [Streptomyces sp. H27-D2]
MAGTRTDRPTVYPVLTYRDARAAVTLLTEAFGFTQVALYEGEDGSVAHAEFSYGNGMVMLSSKSDKGAHGKATQDARATSVYVVIEDADVHFKRAEQHGAEILMPPTDQDYGSRDYIARDAEGNLWCFGTYAPGGDG